MPGDSLCDRFKLRERAERREIERMARRPQPVACGRHSGPWCSRGGRHVHVGWRRRRRQSPRHRRPNRCHPRTVSRPRSAHRVAETGKSLLGRRVLDRRGRHDHGRGLHPEPGVLREPRTSRPGSHHLWCPQLSATGIGSDLLASANRLCRDERRAGSAKRKGLTREAGVVTLDGHHRGPHEGVECVGHIPDRTVSKSYP